MKRKVKLLALIPAMLLTLTVVLTLLTGAAHAYKLAVDVPLSNGHKVTVQFADNFPDQLLQTHVGYMQTYIPRIAELFYMPDHDFEFAYDTEPPPDGCPPSGSTAGWRRICLRTDTLEWKDVAAPIVHEVTHVFQDEIPPGFSTLLW